jgi:biopolymer transport protein ExbB/TolQ
MPLSGFFIFVVGVIHMLQGMRAAEGRFGPYLAGSFEEALWATTFSLLAGAPVIWFHKYFAAKQETLLMQMDRLSLALISQIANPPNRLTGYGSVKAYDTRSLDVRVTERLRN